MTHARLHIIVTYLFLSKYSVPGKSSLPLSHAVTSVEVCFLVSFVVGGSSNIVSSEDLNVVKLLLQRHDRGIGNLEVSVCLSFGT